MTVRAARRSGEVLQLLLVLLNTINYKISILRDKEVFIGSET